MHTQTPAKHEFGPQSLLAQVTTLQRAGVRQQSSCALVLVALLFSPSCIAGASPGAGLVELAPVCSGRRVRPIAFLLWSLTFWLLPQSEKHLIAM